MYIKYRYFMWNFLQKTENINLYSILNLYKLFIAISVIFNSCSIQYLIKYLRIKRPSKLW